MFKSFALLFLSNKMFECLKETNSHLSFILNSQGA